MHSASTLFSQHTADRKSMLSGPSRLHSQQPPLPSRNSSVCRAIDGDVVAVELLPEARWRGASTRLPTPAESTTSNEDAEEDDADEPEGGHIAQVGGCYAISSDHQAAPGCA